MDAIDRAMLDFEGRTWMRTGLKNAAILEQFGPLVAYRVRLLRLLEDPDATRYRPDVVRRLRDRIS